MDQRSCAHAAGFQGYIQSAAGQTVIACPQAGGTEGEYLGMRTGITQAYGLIPALTQQLIRAHDHGAYRHLSLRFRTGRKRQGVAHPLLIDF
jgi:hypothetical protein